jgi:lycopene cyclase domain-containing protein
MSLIRFWYLLTILIFTGAANYLIWSARGHLLRKHWKFIVTYVVFTIPWAYWDAVALRWQAYQYNPAHTLSIKIFGAELETYVFMGLVGATVCSATVIYMRQEERGKLRLRYRSRKTRRQRLKPRRLVAAAGATKR